MTEPASSKEPIPSSSESPSGVSDSWPQSHGIYNVTISVPVSAQNEGQAKRRAEDMMSFLTELRSDEQGPHQGVLYMYDSPTVKTATRLHGVYNVSITIPMVAHSEEQAGKRTKDMIRFLGGLLERPGSSTVSSCSLSISRCA